MKKNTFILALTLLLISLYYSLPIYNTIMSTELSDIAQFQSEENHGNDLYSLQITDSINDINSELFHQTFEDLLVANSLFAIKLVYTTDSFSNLPVSKFYYSRNTPNIEEKIYLLDDYARLDGKSLYSTYSDNKSTRIVTFPNIDSDIELGSILQDDENSGMYNLLSNDKNLDFTEQCANFCDELYEIFPSIQFMTINYGEGYSVEKTSFIDSLFDMVLHTSDEVVLINITVSVLLCIQIFNRRRRISIMIISGNSKSEIYWDLYERNFLISVLVLCSALCLFLTLFVRNHYTLKAILSIVLSEYMLFIIIQQLISVVYLALIGLIPIVAGEKGKSNLLVIYWLGFIVKVSFIMLVLPIIQNILRETKSMITMMNHKIEVSETLKSQYYFGNERASNYFSDIDKENYRLLKSNFVVSNQFMRFNEGYLFAAEYDKIPCYFVDENYFKHVGVYDESIDYTSTIVVAINANADFDEVKLTSMLNTSVLILEPNIVFITFDKELPSYSPEELLYRTNIDSNRPLVYIPEEPGYRGQIEAGMMTFHGNLSQVQAYVDTKFHNFGYESAFRMVPVSSIYQHLYKNSFSTYMKELYKLLIIILGYSITNIFLIDIDVIKNKRKYYIGYIEGATQTSLIHYGKNILSPLCIAIPFTIAISQINNYIFIAIALVLIIELSLFIYYSHQIKRKGRN